MVDKIAFLYPGQGSQKVGMSSELLKSTPGLFETYLGRSDAVAGVPVTKYSLEGPTDILSQTNVAQPALFSHSLALTAYARQFGLYPDMVAGHSLGEYTAAVAAGVLSFEDGLHLVSQRGKLMYQAQSEQPGTMAAIVNLPAETLHTLCEEISQRHYVTVTNWNTPTQFVVSGVEAGVLELIEVLRAHPTVRAMRLPVKGAFHSLLMKPVQSSLHTYMHHLTWNDARVPLVANVSGRRLTDRHDVRQELLEQITSPVRWVTCIEALVAAGCDTFVEIGSSQVLTRMMRAIAPDKQVFSVDSPAKIEALATQLNEPLYVQPTVKIAA